MKLKYITLGLAAALTLAGCQKDNAGDQTSAPPPATGEAIAHVNGEPVSRLMFEFHLERRTNGQPALASEEDREALLKELIDLTLLAQEAEQKGLAKQETVAARLQNLRSAVLAQAAVENMLEQEPDDAAVQAEYEKHFQDEQGLEYHARHILVEDKESAEKLIVQLDDGTDFIKLAEEHSSGPTGPNGGDLGWFQPEQMVPPFSEAVATLEPGTYTKEPVETQFGWHVIKLEESRSIAPPPLADVRQQLVALIAQERIESRVEELRKAADIKIDESKQQGAVSKEADDSLDETHKSLDS